MLQELRTVTARKIVYTAIFAGALTISLVLGKLLKFSLHKQDYEGSWVAIGAVILLVTGLTWLLLSLLDWQSLRESPARSVGRRAPFVAGALMLVAWTPVYLTFWPLASMNDTHWILQHPLAAAVQHPLAYNLAVAIPYRLGIAVTGSDLGGVVFAAVTQMVLWAVASVFLLRYLRSVGISRGAFWSLAIYFAFCPLLADYAFALTKDSFFAVFVILLLPVLLSVRQTRGEILRKWPFSLLVIIVLGGFAVTRNNGLVVMVLIAVLLVVYATAARRLAVVISLIAIGLSLVPLAITSSISGPQQFKEAVGIPLQQIGYAAQMNPNCLPEEARAYFDEILPIDQWAEAYSPLIVDSIKDSAGFNSAYLTDTKATFLKYWASSAVSCTPEFVRAYLTHTAPLWSARSGFIGEIGQSFFDSPISNYPSNRDELIADYAQRGISSHPYVPLPMESLYRSLIHYTPAGSVWLWAGGLSIIGFLYRRRSEWVAIYAPTALIVITLLIAAPVAVPFRYIAPVLVVVPAAYAVLFGTTALPRDKSPARHQGESAD